MISGNITLLVLTMFIVNLYFLNLKFYECIILYVTLTLIVDLFSYILFKNKCRVRASILLILSSGLLVYYFVCFIDDMNYQLYNSPLFNNDIHGIYRIITLLFETILAFIVATIFLTVRKKA